MQVVLRGELAFVAVTLTYRGTSIEVPDVLIDTGAASTVINADIAAEAGVYLQPQDRLRTLRGVGGSELVFVRQVDRLAIGEHGLRDFEVEIGEMDYGLELTPGLTCVDPPRFACRAISSLRTRLVRPVSDSAAPRPRATGCAGRGNTGEPWG